MKRAITLSVMVVWASLTAGCSQLSNPAKEQGQQRWQATRAAMMLSRADEQYKNGDLEGANASLVQALELQNDLTEAKLLLCEVQIARREYTKALGGIDELLAAQGDNWRLHYLKGAAYEGLGSYEQALGYYRKATELDRDQVEPLMSQVECLSVLHRLTDALIVAEESLIPLAQSAAAYEIAGDLCMSMQRYDRAVGHYRFASSFAPQSIELQHSLACAYYSAGDYKNASAILETLVTKSPYNKSSWTNSMLGDCRMAMNDPARASDSYSRASDLDSDNVSVMVNLSKACLANEDYPRAVLAARRALRKDGSNLSASMVLAYSLMRQGNNSEAIDELIRSANSHPDDATLLCLIGKAYEASGEIQQARMYYKKALEIEAGNRLASSLLAGIDR